MAVFSGPEVINNGLVLHLDAANSRSYSGTGTAWNDLSGNSNNGTLLNGVGYNSTNNGIMVFDGVDDYGYVNESATSKPIVAITVCAFIYPTLSSYSNARLIGDWHQDASYDRWIIYSNGTTISWYMRTATTTEGGTTGWTIVPNQWVSLVGRYDGSSQDLFVNGNFFSSRSGVTGNMRSGDGNRPIRFGIQGTYSGTATGGGTFSGNMSNIQMYNRALSGIEIKQNFEAARSRYNV